MEKFQFKFIWFWKKKKIKKRLIIFSRTRGSSSCSFSISSKKKKWDRWDNSSGKLYQIGCFWLMKNASRQTKRYTFIDQSSLEFITFQFTPREDSVWNDCRCGQVSSERRGKTIDFPTDTFSLSLSLIIICTDGWKNFLVDTLWL